MYNLLILMVALSAAFGYLNHRFLKLPHTIGIMSMSLILSVAVYITGQYIPELKVIGRQLSTIDFNTVLMKIMLGFLLFAGGFHFNIKSLRKEIWTISTLSLVGTVISTFIVGWLSYLLFNLFGISIPFIYCLLFGSLISPTDPISVLGILKESSIPKSLHTKIAGESLFNDGVGVVLFLTIIEIIKIGTYSYQDIFSLCLQEIGGGVIYGLMLGYIGSYTIKSIDNYKVEVLITLAIVMVGYTLADIMHVSGPIAMVIAGIITGNKGRQSTMSDITYDYLSKFWELIDEILNSILFLLIGFEMLVIKSNETLLIVGLLSIIIIFLARWLSVLVPISILKYKIPFEKDAIKIITLGGLRGGISVALALSLTEGYHREEIVYITYIVVIFSVVIQGLLFNKFYKK